MVEFDDKNGKQNLYKLPEKQMGDLKRKIPLLSVASKVGKLEEGTPG